MWMEEKKKELGTFLVQVQYCQNATWQGEIVWTEKNQRQRFRSDLELLRLMDSALEQSIQASEG